MLIPSLLGLVTFALFVLPGPGTSSFEINLFVIRFNVTSKGGMIGDLIVGLIAGLCVASAAWMAEKILRFLLSHLL
jgi:hypothetical protein